MARHVVTEGLTRNLYLPKDEQRCTAELPSGDRCKKRRSANNDRYCHLHARREST